MTELGFGHHSLYMLQIEEGTPFEKLKKTNPDLFPCDDLVADLYELTQEHLAGKGYNQYEVSNFA